MNLAFAFALNRKLAYVKKQPRVGILDLDIFGPSVPKLMGLELADEPHFTPSMSCFVAPLKEIDDRFVLAAGAIVPLVNHGLPCMSMGFLLPRPEGQSNVDVPVVWRGLMVQKAVQQLLFDVDWRSHDEGEGLDLLIIDMPPGTGDVPLTLGQLVVVDGRSFPFATVEDSDLFLV